MNTLRRISKEVEQAAAKIAKIEKTTKTGNKGSFTMHIPARKVFAEKVTHLKTPPLKRPRYELGDLLIHYLEQLGIEYVFGVPGGPIEPLFNALARSQRRGGPRAVIARHETGAAFMADGYARNTGRLGVCCGTVGPGTTNLITGVASAYDNYSPMLVITAQTPLANFGKGAAQESADTGINTVAMFSHCTRFSSLVSHADQFEQKLVSAVTAATKAPYGPAHLSVPLDIMRSPSGVIGPTYNLQKLVWQSELVDHEKIKRLVKKLLASRKCVFLIGECAASAIDNILAVALMLNAAIITTPHGKGLINPYHPQFCGVIGFCGHKSAMDLIDSDEVDLVVAVGTSLQEAATNAWTVLQKIGDRMVHVDESESNLMRSPLAQLHVQGNINKTFIQVYERLRTQLDRAQLNGHRSKAFPRLVSVGSAPRLHIQQDEPEKTCSDASPIKPQRLMAMLPRLFPTGTRYLCDSGNSMAWSIHYLHPYDRRIANRRNSFKIQDISQSGRRQERREMAGGIFWTCLEYGSMGWAIGSSVGTALACLHTPTVCITGDGSVLMSGGDITVALQENLNIFFIILNDSEYGMVKQGQRLGNGEPIGYTLPKVDFVKWAKSMGMAGYYVYSPDDLKKLDFTAMTNTQGPKILDVHVDPEEIPPIKNRLKALGSVE